MKLNLLLAAGLVDIARLPELGHNSQAYFAPEVCKNHGVVTTTGATTATWRSNGGAPLPDAGRILHARLSSENVVGSGGAMVITLNVILDDEGDPLVGTAVATFDLPTHTPFTGNIFPIGASRDFIPAGEGNANKKIRSVTSVASVANMPLNAQFEIWSTPNDESFVYLDCGRSKGGEEVLPMQVPIACGKDPQAYTVSGRPDTKTVSFTFANRGNMEQLGRFNGTLGTFRIDVIKGDVAICERIIYNNVQPNVSVPRGDGNEDVVGTSEMLYNRFLKGYFTIEP
jgi:hypothetical protein